MSRKLTHEEFMAKFEEKQPELFAKTEVLGEYINNCTKIKCRCKIDGYERDVDPRNLLRGANCPRCSNCEQYTTEIFKSMVYKVNPNIIIIGEYINSRTNIECECAICGKRWWANPRGLLCGKGCSACAGLEKYTTKTFKEKLKIINSNIEIIGEYINNKTKIKCKCLIDGYEWYTKPNSLLMGHGCPKCTHSGTSWFQEELFNYFSEKYPSTIARDKTLIGKELDIVIPELNIAIEPGSWYWHFEFENKLSNDYQKQLLCKEKGYTCITLYDACDFPDVLWYPALVYDKDIGQNKDMLQQVIQDIEQMIQDHA